jgi:hypothetical protein
MSVRGLFPSGTPQERSAWSKEHPWVAGLYWSVLFWPPFALIGLLLQGWRELWLIVPLFFLGWLAFSVLLKRQWNPQEGSAVDRVMRVIGGRNWKGPSS